MDCDLSECDECETLVLLILLYFNSTIFPIVVRMCERESCVHKFL